MLSDERIRQFVDDIFCSEGTRREIEHSIRFALAEAAVCSQFKPGESGRQSFVVGTVDMTCWPPIAWREGLVRQDVKAFDGMPVVVSTPAAQSPAVPVAEAYVYEDDDGDDILGLRLLREDYPMQHGERLYTAPPANCITQTELDAKDARILELEGALQGLLNIVNDSYGVDGYHLNGDVAHWSSFDEVAIAEAAIAKERQS